MTPLKIERTMNNIDGEQYVGVMTWKSIIFCRRSHWRIIHSQHHGNTNVWKQSAAVAVRRSWSFDQSWRTSATESCREKRTRAPIKEQCYILVANLANQLLLGATDIRTRRRFVERTVSNSSDAVARTGARRIIAVPSNNFILTFILQFSAESTRKPQLEIYMRNTSNSYHLSRVLEQERVNRVTFILGTVSG